MTDPLLNLKSVAKSFPSGSHSLHLFQSLSLSVEKGTMISIEGASGSGKSTLLNLISGLEPPSAGTIYSCGYQVEKLSEKQMGPYRNRHIGFVFQFHYLLKEFNALENVMMPALIGGKKRKTVRQQAKDLLSTVGLIERANHFPSQLSGGEKQRVTLARSLINDPDLILADEPTGNLDAANSSAVIDLLLSLVKDHQKTLVLVTHNPELFAAATTERYLLKKGSLQKICV